MLIKVEQRSPEWLKSREGKITASVAAACLGLDPNRGPLSAWNEITGRKSQKVNSHMAWGTNNELAAKSAYELETGNLIEDTGLWVSDVYPWLAASPDGLVGENGLVEIKCPVKPREKPCEADIIQMRVQLACTRREWCDWYAYHAFVDGEPYARTARINRESVEEELLTLLEEFYEKYVKTDTPPPRRKGKK